MATPPKASPGDTKKKGKVTYRMSSSGKWFKSKTGAGADKQRALNSRLNAPISQFATPQGVLASPTTERDLAHEAGAATTVKYGAQRSGLASELANAVTQRGGTDYWYKNYQDQLATWRQQIADQQAAQVQAAQALPGMVQGLGQQQQGVVQQQQAQQNALTGAVADPKLATDANQANQASQAIGANWAGLAQNTADARNAYAGNLVNVVAPAQRATALQAADQNITGIKAKQSDLAGVEGAYNENYRQTRRTDEQKTLLAEATLGFNSQKADDANKTANRRITASTKTANARLKQQQTAERDRHSTAMQNAQTSADRLAETQRHNRAMEKLKVAGKKKGKGDWLPQGQANKSLSDAVKIKSFAQRAKDGKAFVDGHPNQAPLSRSAAAAKLRASTPKTLDEALLSAVLDSVYVGHLSPYTVRKLIQAKYKPSQVASTLGTVTRGGMKGNQNIRDAADSAGKVVRKVI